MKTAVEYIELRLLGIASFDSEELRLRYKDIIKQAKEIEKEHIQKAFSDGQETPINHPNIPHYSREEYYNDKFILETRFQD
jgi:hypothetical protein